MTQFLSTILTLLIKRNIRYASLHNIYLFTIPVIYFDDEGDTGF
ncbi:hypothetical protein RintRC_5126 [Richelia intracellularis]|nr:hypothetical protein RintRC_5126 [Richelia intracellularis]